VGGGDAYTHEPRYAATVALSRRERETHLELSVRQRAVRDGRLEAEADAVDRGALHAKGRELQFQPMALADIGVLQAKRTPRLEVVVRDLGPRLADAKQEHGTRETAGKRYGNSHRDRLGVPKSRIELLGSGWTALEARWSHRGGSGASRRFRDATSDKSMEKSASVGRPR
jgi:hypothetical protein